MSVLAISLCLFIAAFAVFGVISPDGFLQAVRRLTSLRGLYFTALFRLAFGVVLFLSASASRAPHLVEVIAAILIVSGVLTPLLSHERYRKIVDWWSSGGRLYVRVWAACAASLLGLLALVLLPG